MIEFTCSGCGRAFTVPEAMAGRKARCKSCGSALIVPMPAPAGPAKPPPRMRRLIAESQQMSRAFGDFELIHLKSADGEPPEVYQVEYRIEGLEEGKGGTPRLRNHHVVQIQLTADYPRLAPACKMLTPIFHPNIDPATICIGDHWTAGERLVDLAIRIGEMIAYQAYNIKSPLNAEAAMWADLHQDELPIDGRNLHPPELE